MAGITKLSRLGSGEPAGVGTGPVSCVGLRIGTPVGSSWIGVTSGATTNESLEVATPLGNKEGPDVEEGIGVDVGRGTDVAVAGGLVGISIRPWASQPKAEANKTSVRLQVTQVLTRRRTSSNIAIDYWKNLPCQ